MDQQRWDKIELLLDQALFMENLDQQRAYLKKACKGNKQLYREAIQLLNCIREARETGFLERR